MKSYKVGKSLTRERFLFHETGVTARLMADESLPDVEMIRRIVNENLFQFPTEWMIRNLPLACL